MLRRLGSTARPPSAAALLRLFGRLELLRGRKVQLKMLVRRAQVFTPDVADQVRALARSDPDAALETFVTAFQRAHFELDESVCEQGFDVWADVASEFIPLLPRGTDRCNGIDPLGWRSGYALQWALIQDVFYGDERSQLIAEVAQAFGETIADRLAASDPPEHQVLCQRLTRSPFAGIIAFSRWALGDVSGNDILFLHAHHADELLIPWTRRGVARAARLIRKADDFQAPMLALARWLEHAPSEHGPLLVDAVLGRQDAQAWTRSAVQPCPTCGFPPAVMTGQEATGLHLLDYASHPSRTAYARTYPEEDSF